MVEKEWFSTWFDTAYYHVLYKHRNDSEASIFIEKLTKELNLPSGAHVLDLACGKGRHSLKLHQTGLNVLGVDLSKNSIIAAKETSKEIEVGLKFDVHDMREIIPDQSFDAIFNLFTSFGYFDKSLDNERVVNAIHKMLNVKGLLVIDFMNARKTIKNLVLSEEKCIDNINFHIERKWDGNHIYKFIEVVDKEKKSNYMERVQSLFLSDFLELLEDKFVIKNIFGDYQLNSFNEDDSDRLIIIAEKK